MRLNSLQKKLHLSEIYFFSAEEQTADSWVKSHCFHVFLCTNALAYHALRTAVKDEVLWLRCSQGFFWTCVINLLLILKDWSRALHLSSKVISIFLWSPCDIFVVFWHWFKGSLVTQTSTPRAASGETCTLWQEHRHAKVRFLQQILHKLFQDSTLWTKLLTQPQGFCWSELSWPLCLYWGRSTAETQPRLHIFSLQNSWGEISLQKWTYAKSNILWRKRRLEGFLQSRQGWCSTSPPAAANAPSPTEIRAKQLRSKHLNGRCL